MSDLRGTLLTDGSSDQALIPLLQWLLRQHVPHAMEIIWADPTGLPQRLQSLGERIHATIDAYPCDVLFIHRDAEAVPHVVRVEEIRRAVNATATTIPTVPIVPVRMLEAWLLLDEGAVRKAAGNPHGKQPLELPRTRDLERLIDPKTVLHTLLRTAIGPGIRRRSSLNVYESTHLVAELISDFAPLRVLPAFQALEAELVRLIEEQGWKTIE